LFYGASNGLVTIVRGIVPLALFGPHGYGRRLGMISAPSLAVKAASPMVFAAVLAQSGAGQTLALALGSALIAGVAMGILCLRERHIR
ncbi:MAG: MFS transporter, partial [Hyphomicrobiales bacterium]|nr:MFS transporter [Hyphomicrobiales bacterium]